MSPNQVPYKFPSPNDAASWQQSVQEALGKTLSWSRVEGQDRWTLSGTCPRCKGEMSQEFTFKVIIPDTFGDSVMTPGRGAKVDCEVVCNCSDEHRKDVRGCGFGKGVKVPLQSPEL